MNDVKLPQLGENIGTATVVKINVRAGDAVKKDQTLLEIEVDKATIDIPSPYDGVVKEILIKENEEITVGQSIVKMEASKQSEPASPAKGEGVAIAAEVPVSTPATRRNEPRGGDTISADVPAAPSVRMFAREIGVDITLVSGSGTAGRITEEDVKAYAKKILTGKAPVAQEEEKLPDFSKWGDVELRKMTKLREKTVRHLSTCWRTIPHVYQFGDADITETEGLISRYSTGEIKITITAVILKVVAEALKVFPQFNVSGDANALEFIQKKYFHIGLAVAAEHGLLVPVIRDVDKKNIQEIATSIKAVSSKAKEKKTTLEDMSGGCFTVTNLGAVGAGRFAPIINWPEVAILGVSTSRIVPAYVDGKISPRKVLPLCLSYDHRFLDGVDGARFMDWIIKALEQPASLKLEG